MKKYIAILLILLPLSLCAQSRFDGFFQKKNGVPVSTLLKGEGDKSLKLYVRPTVNLNAMVLTYDKLTRSLETSAFSALGIGVGLQHYEEIGGVLVNDYGANLLLIINGADPSQAGFGLAATVNALQFFNIGAGYDFTNKRPQILIGASWSF
jgi:hypothetical protein